MQSKTAQSNRTQMNNTVINHKLHTLAMQSNETDEYETNEPQL